MNRGVDPGSKYIYSDKGFTSGSSTYDLEGSPRT